VATLVEGQFPAISADILAQDVGGIISPSALEIAVLWRQPSIKHLEDVDRLVAEVETARRFLTTVSCVTLHAYAGHALIRRANRIGRESLADRQIRKSAAQAC